MTDRLATLLAMSLFWCAVSCTDQPGQEYQIRTDMYEQPSFKHQEDPLAAVKGTTRYGWRGQAPADSAEAAGLKNPYAFSPAAEDTGRILFETYCSPCHGTGAKGNGPVAAKFQTPPDLHAAKYLSAPDGYFYYVISNGVRIMPPYFENTAERERWLIVAHLRNLQRP